jgi:hypothetical protein
MSAEVGGDNHPVAKNTQQHVTDEGFTGVERKEDFPQLAARPRRPTSGRPTRSAARWLSSFGHCQRTEAASCPQRGNRPPLWSGSERSHQVALIEARQSERVHGYRTAVTHTR